MDGWMIDKVNSTTRMEHRSLFGDYTRAMMGFFNGQKCFRHSVLPFGSAGFSLRSSVLLLWPL